MNRRGLHYALGGGQGWFAIAEAAVERIKAGGDPQVEIMVPLVMALPELGGGMAMMSWPR